MYYEEVALKAGETLYKLTLAYGHDGTAWTGIWADPKNSKLKALRLKPEKLQVGDIIRIPIKWKIMVATIRKPQSSKLRFRYPSSIRLNAA